jgi:hypothetical protein
MKTSDTAVRIDYELGPARRCIRAAIGTVALLTILLVPGVSEGWLFALSMIVFYAGLTAFLNVDFVDALIVPVEEKMKEGGFVAKIRHTAEDRETFPKAA